MQSCLKVSVSLTVRRFDAAACGVSWCTRSIILGSFSSTLKHNPTHTLITEYYFWEIMMLLTQALMHKYWSGKGIMWSWLQLRRHLFYSYREKHKKQSVIFIFTLRKWMNSVHDLSTWRMHLFVHSWDCCNRPFRESIYLSVYLWMIFWSLTVLYNESGQYLSYQSSMFRFRRSLRMPYCLFVCLFMFFFIIHFILLM